MVRGMLALMGVLSLITTTRGEEGLGMRESFNALVQPSVAWDLDKGIAVKDEAGTVVLRIDGARYASAAPRKWETMQPETQIWLKLASRSGEFSAQVEWLDEGGKFLEAIPALTVENADKGLDGARLEEFRSKKFAAQAKQFRVKLWLGGENAVAALNEFRICAPRRISVANVLLLKQYDASSKIEKDSGIVVTGQAGALKVNLDGSAPFSAVVFADRADYRPNGHVLLDVAGLSPSSSLTLQVLCWDSAGKHLKSVDLMKDMLEAGLYEVALSEQAGQFPPTTASISFKLWLGGRSAEARVAGLFYGAAR